MRKALKIAAVLMLGVMAAPLAIAAEAPAVEMSEIDTPTVKAQQGGISIEVPGEAQCHVVVYALTGLPVKQLDVAPGVTRVDLPAGIYLVRVGRTTVRVAVK